MRRLWPSPCKKREEKVTVSNIIDSSVWLAYFIDGKFMEIIEADGLHGLCVLSLFEIKKRLKSKVPESELDEKMGFIRQKSNIFVIDEGIADMAADIFHEKGIPAMDSIIYATARKNNAGLITMDNDFRGLDGVVVLKP
jgi:predicted nucleic acid-binding protein